MFLRSSFSNTKMFFQKTLESFKYFLSGGYQKLPKSPPFNPFSGGACADMSVSQSYGEFDMHCTDFTNRWDGDKQKAAKMQSRKKIVSATGPKHEVSEVINSPNLMKLANLSPANSRKIASSREQQKKKKVAYYKRKSKEKEDASSYGIEKEERNSLVAQKLKELEMVDKSNVEHALDIEEVLHYYSRLTCPAYVDIVDKFLMEMCSELLSPQASSNFAGNSRMRPPSLTSHC